MATVATPHTALRRTPPSGSWDVDRVRADFPVLARVVNGRPLAYLDNAATSQKPRPVIEALTEFYQHGCANVHRGVHALSQEASVAYDAVRERAAQFLNAASPLEIIFTHGTTAGLNLVAQSHGGATLHPGDEILVSVLEHHSNIVPWHLVAQRTGARVRAIPLTPDGDLDLEAFQRMLSERTRIVAVTHASNVLGTVTPLADLARLAHQRGAVVVVDGAQSAPHLPIDVQALECDFFACSPHKMFGPMGVGLLYGRAGLLEAMPPWQGGGGMIESVEIDRSTYAPIPTRFEAGTPPVAEVLGLGAAIDYLAGWDRAAALRHEETLLGYAIERLRQVPGVRLFPSGSVQDRVSVLSFVVDGIHAHDVGQVLDAAGVAVRVGHHCAQPLMQHLGVAATVRASFAPYNALVEVDALVAGVERAREVFAV